ncbi:MAG: glycosyltransferase family 4 protein [Acidobacteriia bacterium]|nr:glycosyltransferase family 4 protein [Terriglobia bacterium]
MRVLYCNKYNFPFSGTEVYLFELMELMRSRGHDVALFSMADPRGKPTEYDRHFVPHVDFKGSRSLMGHARLAAHAIYSREARRRLCRMIDEFRPDVAHLRNIYHHLSPSILWELKAQGVPVLYHVNDFKLLCPSYNMVAKGKACELCRGGRFWRVMTEDCYTGPHGSAVVLAAEAYFHRWLRTYEKCVDRFLAPSQFVKVRLMQNGWDGRKIDVLPHFQEVPEQAPPAPDADAPILYFGRLSAEKGLPDLLRAMHRVPHIRLLIAGDGPQRTELERLALGLGLTRVDFLGLVPPTELQQRIGASRFTVLPSHAYETLGKSILESYAQGRAVIASDLGSRRELVHEGKTGLLFRPGNVQELAEAISFLAERPGFAAEMGAAGRELVRRRHSPESHVVAITALYEQLRAQNKPAGGARSLQVKVAFIGGRGVVSKYSGIEAYYEEVGQRLTAMGHDVTVYCRSYFTPPLEEHHGMWVCRLPTIRSKHLETLVHTCLSTVHASFSRCDIVHYHALGPALFSFIPRLFGKKTVVTVQGLDWQRKKWGRIAATVLRLGEQAAARLPNATMVVSRVLEEHFRTTYRAETIYVPNGTTIRERRAASRILDWDLEPGNYILYLGRLSPEKNCHLLVQAYEHIDTSVKLVMAGGSSYSDIYADELRRHQGDRIKVLDWISGNALEELLTNAMLFVLPSDLEGMSLALLDAMGAGVCVLASDIPENREAVEGAGFTFKRGDVHDLERMLRLLIADTEVREEASRKGQERVRERYLWPRIAEQIEAVYVRLLGQAEADRPPRGTGPAERDHARVA